MAAPRSEVENYNNLLPIMDATSYLANAGGELIIVPILEKIVDLGLADVIGLRLLHKHNDLKNGESMVEQELIDSDGYALVTSAVSQRSNEAVPNSWQLTADGCVAIEYSDPDLLCSQRFDIRANSQKLTELHALLAQMKMDHVLGPSINYSEYAYKGKDIRTVAFLEKTDIENRANVVRLLDRDDPSIKNSAKTKWYAQRVQDADGKSKWLTACNCFCSVSPNGDGHQGTTTHIYSGDDEAVGSKKKQIVDKFIT